MKNNPESRTNSEPGRQSTPSLTTDEAIALRAEFLQRVNDDPSFAESSEGIAIAAELVHYLAQQPNPENVSSESMAARTR